MEALELHPQRYSILIRSLSWRPLINKEDDFLMHSVLPVVSISGDDGIVLERASGSTLKPLPLRLGPFIGQ
jgi:hypothetical protein